MRSLQELVTAWVQQEGPRLEREWGRTIIGYGLDPTNQFTYDSITYNTNPFRAGTDLVMPKQTLINNTSVPQTQSFKWEEKTESSYSFTMTETLNVGVTVSVSASFPGFGGASAETRMDLNVSSSSTQSKSITKTWSVDIPVTVPARTKVVCESIIASGNQEATFYVSVIGSGRGMWIDARGANPQDIVTYYKRLAWLPIDLSPSFIGPHYTRHGQNDIKITPPGIVRAGFGVEVISTFTESAITARLGDPEIVTRKYSISDHTAPATAKNSVSSHEAPSDHHVEGHHKEQLDGAIWVSSDVHHPKA